MSAFIGPLPLLRLLSQIIQRMHDVREVLDESTIEIAESKETANFFNCRGALPLGDPLYLDGIHMDFPVANYHPKIFDFILVEGALLRLNEKIEFL